ncbi:diaminobutyrate-2-oxoglutarate transaminase [Duganella sacchari]|uniref:Diaminobutyrate-2-oxoglutarate transaminase n=1 Tax=Duganella sacchari TaxID=551987 RepID=A0A1M7KVP0_9BURK|nr:MFS transporter [Duganella sacchari]SHM69564.1 diaminobutyrate-2-oxoglutarate transaminase [Duganella sacchari]
MQVPIEDQFGVQPVVRPDRPASVRLTFLLLWLSESAFDLGSTLISFAIGVWIYSHTGSVQDYSLSVLAAAVSSMLIMPFAGAFVDRYNRQWVVVCCDLVSIFSTAAIVLALSVGQIGVEVLYLYTALSAAVASLRRSAVRVVISSFVPKDRFTQVSGLSGVSRAVVQVAAPNASGFLMAHLGLQAVMGVHLSLLTGGALLAFSALSRVRNAIRGRQSMNPQHSFLVSARTSFQGAIDYLKDSPLMRSLLLYGALVQCLLVLATVMLTPLVLSTHSTDVLGLVMSVGVVGALAGSLLAATSIIKRHLMLWVLICDAIQSAAILVAGLSTSPVIWCVAAFACLFGGSASVACSGALWMRKAPLAQQGSVFAVLSASNLLVMSLVLLIGGYLVDAVLEPAFAAGGAWTHSVGSWFGTGKGRGIAFLFFVAGACGFLLSVVALASPKLRQLESLVPERSDD